MVPDIATIDFDDLAIVIKADIEIYTKVGRRAYPPSRLYEAISHHFLNKSYINNGSGKPTDKEEDSFVEEVFDIVFDLGICGNTLK